MIVSEMHHAVGISCMNVLRSKLVSDREVDTNNGCVARGPVTGCQTAIFLVGICLDSYQPSYVELWIVSEN